MCVTRSMRVGGVVLCLATTLGCGSTERDESDPTSGTSSGGAAGNGVGGNPASNASASSSASGGSSSSVASSSSGMTSGGNETTTATSTTGAIEPQGPRVSGPWGMFGFEDPVTVVLVDNGDTTVDGRGCCGPQDTAVGLDCCGPVMGERAEADLSFAFPTGTFGFFYRTEAVISEDGTRMGGWFASTESLAEPFVGRLKTAWLPLTPDGLLPPNPDVVEATSRLGFVNVLLTEDSEQGDGFAHGESYVVYFTTGSLAGDLGPFWSTELQIHDDGIMAGPVPNTDPSLPKSALIRLDGDAVVDAELAMPSGATYRFEPAPPEE